MRLALCLCLGLLFVAGHAHAQDLVAPRVKSLPGIEVPEDVPVPESGVVRVRVRIDPDGKGFVQKCEAEQAICDLVADAMRRAEFEPAKREGNPVPAEVSVELRVRQASEEESEAQLEPESASIEKELLFTETALVDARAQAPIKLELEGIRNIPGTFGEPFRTLELMPGTVPVANGQPYVYVRGAPPSGTVYLYDDIPIPLLFHSALGPATIQPGLIGGIELYSGAAPARYGGATGGVVAARARRFDNDRVHGEADIRAIDVSALLNVPMPKEGSMTFAGRYGFPNLILGAVDVDADVKYWDYQYRTGVAMSERSRFEMVALGGRDSSVLDSRDPDERLAFDLQFHRVEARFLGRVKRWDFMGSLLYGYDFSDINDASMSAIPDSGANIHRIGPRFRAVYGARKARLRLGGEMSALLGAVQCDTGIQSLSAPCDPNFAAQDRRIIGSAFADADVSPWRWLDISLGLRVDVWNTAGQRDVGVGPRARATFHAKDIADVFFGWGLGYRPATFAIPLPGLGDVPLEAGLQRANQTEGGVRFFLPFELSFEARGFINQFRDLRFVDIFTDPEISDDPVTGIPAGVLDDSADGKSYGLELLLQRPFDMGVTALASYTLGYSDLEATGLLLNGPPQDLDYTPSYDVRHVLNAALSWQAKFGLIIGARLFSRSGRAEGWLWLDPNGVVQQYVQRVPWFTRLDLMVAYEWSKPGRRMRISFEWINVTRAKDAQQIDSTNPASPFQCQVRWGVPSEPCPISFTTAIWFPNLSFRAVF
jgi:hypothetical protein